MPSKSVRIKQWNENRNKEERIPGNVYIIKLSDSLYKVGRTADLAKRLTNYRTSSLNANYVWSAYVLDMFQAERELHLVFRESKIKREIFSLRDYQIRLAEKVISYLKP